MSDKYLRGNNDKMTMQQENAITGKDEDFS